MSPSPATFFYCLILDFSTLRVCVAVSPGRCFSRQADGSRDVILLFVESKMSPLLL